MKPIMATHLALLAASACASPPAPALPPEDVFPDLEAAVNCPPVARFAHDWFHFADLDSGRSCPVFLEQDECVLAIFEDCTLRTSSRQRQFQGQISSDRFVEMTPVSETAELTRSGECRGELSDMGGPPIVALRCPSARPPHSGFALEKVADEDPVGVEAREALVAAPSGASLPTILDDLTVTSSGMIWILIRGDGSATSHGAHLFDGARLEEVDSIPLPQARRLAFDPIQNRLVIAAEASLSTYTGEQRAEAVEGFGELRDVRDLAISADGGHALIASAGPSDSALLELFNLETLERVGEPVSVPFAPRVVTPSSSGVSGAEFVFFGFSEVDQEGVAIAYDLGMVEKTRLELAFEVTEAMPNPDGSRTTLLTSNAYWELDLRTQTLSDPIAVPYFEGLRTMAFSGSDRVIVGGGFVPPGSDTLPSYEQDGRITVIDLALSRALQSPVELSSALSRLVFNTSSGEVVAGLATTGQLVTITLR